MRLSPVLSLGAVAGLVYWAKNRGGSAKNGSARNMDDQHSYGATGKTQAWDAVDEAADDSFPASDPPGKY